MIIIPFVSSQCVLIRLPSGQLCVPEWCVGVGRNYLNGAYLAPLEQAGVRFQQFHPFARRADNARFVVGWVDGQLRETESERLIVSPEVAEARLKEQGNTELGDLVRWATDSFRNQTYESYQKDLHILLEESYLAAPTVFGGSGFGGDATQWRLARGLIADAIHKDGTFLDVGCANGLLMESMVVWAAENGYQLEPYGMDISTELAEVARQRLPQWADRIFVGNIAEWESPQKFDFVSVDLGYTAEDRRKELAERLLTDFVLGGGRLIVTSYGLTKDPSKENWSVGNHLRSFGFVVGGEPERFDNVKGKWKRIAYINHK
ncbi:class I SAM-dependent methyltransferase [Chloroflexi bacterium TSY]|nr:class I SAM-dependent methyltransferase [Chloroflexi bacterium TSY]